MFSILAPTDFSPCADNALDYAVKLSSAFGAKLMIMHASEADIKSLSDQDLENTKSKIISRYDQIKKENPTLDCAYSIVKGYAVSEIYNTTINTNYDLVVMGTHGTSQSKRNAIIDNYNSLLGSVTSAIVGYGSIPIIAVHTEQEFKIPKEFILLSDLHNMPSPDSYQFLSLLASKFDSSISITYIENKPVLFSEAFAELNKMQECFAGIPLNYNIIKAQDVENTLLSMPLASNQLLTVIAKEKTGLQDFLGVSMSKFLVSYLNATLLILPEYIAVYPSEET